MAIFGSTNKKEEKKTTAKKSYARTVVLKDGIANEIIIAPWFSEKALLATEKGVYVFSVPISATKAQVAGAIKELYNVTPKKVNLVHLPAKKVSLRTRRGIGSRARRHKAYVHLNAGDTIQFA